MGRDVRAVISANALGDRAAYFYFVLRSSFIRLIKLEGSWCFGDVVIDTRKSRLRHYFFRRGSIQEVRYSAWSLEKEKGEGSRH